MYRAVELKQAGYRQQIVQGVGARHRSLGVATTLICAILLGGCTGADQPGKAVPSAEHLDAQLAATLVQQKFTGTVEQRLESRLGRKVDPKLADLGRTLFFDGVSSLHNDNSCAGCHSPTHGFGDTQSIAIGIQSNLLVGPNRQAVRRQHAFLPQTDVERPLLRAFRRPVRQFAWLYFPPA
jgi:hypothetical protein